MKLQMRLVIMLLLVCGIAQAQNEIIQNIHGRKLQSLNGRWNYIMDPYEMG